MPLIEQDIKKQNKAVKGPVVKEFEWFQMQTRVRKIIQEIIDPIQLQIVKSSVQIQKLQQNDQNFHDKIQYILKMTTNDPQIFQKGVFKKIEDKFQNQQKTLTFLQQQVRNNTIFIDNKISLIDQRMKESNDMIVQIQQLKKSNRQNLQIQIQNFQKVRNNIEINVQKMSSAIQDNQKSSGQKIQRLQKQVTANLMNVENIQKEFITVKKYFENQKSINDELISQAIKLKQQGKEFDQKFIDLNKKIKEFGKIKPFLQDVQIQCKKLLFKIDNIVPIINEAQINQSLYKILPQKFHPRIAVYEFQKYIQLNEKVLSRKFQQDPGCMNFNGQLLIRQSQQRNTKYLTKLKRSYYKLNGVELDFISFQERQRLLNDFDYQKLCEIVDQLEELQNQKNDRKKHHRLTEQDVRRLVNTEIQNEKKFLIQKIHTQLKDSKTYLQNKSQQMHKIFEQIETKFEGQTKKIQTRLKNNQFSFNIINKISNQITPQLILHAEKFNMLHCLNVQVKNYLEKSNQMFYKINDFQKNIQKLKENGINSIQGSFKSNNHYYNRVLSNQQSNKKPQIGIMALGDSDDLSDSLKLPQKYHPQLAQLQPLPNQFDKLTAKIQQIIQSFKSLDQQFSFIRKKNLNSSVSKLTKASQHQIKYRSHHSFDCKKSQQQLNIKQNFSQLKINVSSQKNSAKSFLQIPSFKQQNSTKYCRQPYTTRLSMRKKSCVIPSMAFFNRDSKNGQFMSDQVKNSLGYFSELKKQNSRYLK